MSPSLVDAQAGDRREVVIDFIDTQQLDMQRRRARESYDNGTRIRDIAEELGISKDFAFRLVKESYALDGRSMPDVRARRAALAKTRIERPRFQEMADQVMELSRQGKLLIEIAEQLGMNRDTITKSIKWWHTSRDLRVPDGRSRRKSLQRKSRHPRGRGRPGEDEHTGSEADDGQVQSTVGGPSSLLIKKSAAEPGDPDLENSAA